VGPGPGIKGPTIGRLAVGGARGECSRGNGQGKGPDRQSDGAKRFRRKQDGEGPFPGWASAEGGRFWWRRGASSPGKLGCGLLNVINRSPPAPQRPSPGGSDPPKKKQGSRGGGWSGIAKPGRVFSAGSGLLRLREKGGKKHPIGGGATTPHRGAFFFAQARQNPTQSLFLARCRLLTTGLAEG